MVIPASPIIPGNENHRGVPQLALAQFVDSIGSPLGPQFDGLLPGGFTVRWMFGKIYWTAWRVHPAHVRQIAIRNLRIELCPGQNTWAAF
jgi:hypothetical protein